jgi:hypothetical protein
MLLLSLVKITIFILTITSDLGSAVIMRNNCVKYLAVWLDTKLYFHHRVNYIFSVASKLLGLIDFITYNFSCEILSSHGCEYEVQISLLGCTTV